MRQIREVLRLKFEEGLGERKVAQATGLSRTSVQNYLRKAEQAKLTWPIPNDLNDAQLEELLFPPFLLSLLDSSEPKPPLDFKYLRQELQRKGVTLYLLWKEYLQAHPQGYQYSRFCDLYHTWSKTLDPVMRQIHKAGEKTFVDYAGMTMDVVERVTGEVKKVQIFVATLGASNYTYAEATWTQELPNWIASHVRAFAYFEGCSKFLVPDNLKSGVVFAHRYEPTLNRTYQDMAEHYHIAILPARPRKPRDKAKVECAVKVVEQWILAPLRNRTFFGLEELNEAIWERLEEYNRRPFQKLPGSRLQQYETLEKPALQPLPETPYEFAEWKKVRVHIDYCFEVHQHHYSVPYELIHQELEVRITSTTVEVIKKGQRLLTHVRSYVEGGFTILPEHRPKNHSVYLDWTSERFLSWAGETGEATKTVVGKILSKFIYPEQGFQSCLGIMQLGKTYGADRLEAACRRVQDLNEPKYRNVKNILETGWDQKPLPEKQPELPILEHENVRGATYYEMLN